MVEKLTPDRAGTNPRLQPLTDMLTTARSGGDTPSGSPVTHWRRFAVAATLSAMTKPHPSRMRRPVTSFSATFGLSYVVCDDGAVFRYDEPGWEEVSPIPGSPRAEEVDHPAPKLLGPAGATTLPRAASEG